MIIISVVVLLIIVFVIIIIIIVVVLTKAEKGIKQFIEEALPKELVDQIGVVVVIVAIYYCFC